MRYLALVVILAILAVSSVDGGSAGAQAIPTGDLAQTVPNYATNTGTTDSGRVVAKDVDGFAVQLGAGGALVMIVDSTGHVAIARTLALGNSGAAVLAGASTETVITLPFAQPDASFHASFTSVDANLGLPAGLRVTGRSTTQVTMTYLAPAEDTDITYAVTDY